MGDVREEIGLQRFDAAQLFHHLVKIEDHLIQIVGFIGGVGGRHIDREIALGDFPGGGGQLEHGFFVGLANFPASKEGQANCNKAPIENRDIDLQPIGDVQLIHADQQARVQTRHQAENTKVDKKQRGWKQTVLPLPCPKCLVAHNSTALYPRPRTVLISNPSQPENLSRSLVM